MVQKALLIIDHGSKRKAANDMIFDVVKLVKSMKPDIIVEGAHMELAEPSIEDGIVACIQKGAVDIVVQPFMLSPGRHSISDIPDMVADIAKKHPDITISVSHHFGVHKKIAEVILERSGFIES